VEGIRIYNKRGEIMFSTDKREERTVVDLQAEACYACHERNGPSPPCPRKQDQDLRGPRRNRVVGSSHPSGTSGRAPTPRATPTPRADRAGRARRAPLPRGADSVNDASAPDHDLLRVRDDPDRRAVVRVVFLDDRDTADRTSDEGARAVADGNLDHTITIRDRDELGKLAEAFNTMTASLRYEKEQNQRWADTLQDKVNEKTDELKAIHDRIVHVEKMASLGKLAATVAHELNNPLEAILTYARLIARRIRKDPEAAAAQQPMLEDVDLIAARPPAAARSSGTSYSSPRNRSANSRSCRCARSSTRRPRSCATTSRYPPSVSRPGGVAGLSSSATRADPAGARRAVRERRGGDAGGRLDRRGGRAGAGERRPEDHRDRHRRGIAPEDLPHIFEPFYTTNRTARGSAWDSPSCTGSSSATAAGSP